MASHPIYALNPEEVKETWDNLMTSVADRGITYNDIMLATADDHTMGWMSWLRCALLPEDNIDTPLRYHDQGANVATAAIGMRTPYAINWQQQPILPPQGGGQAGVNQQLGPSDMAIFSFDYSPLHILSIYDPNPNYSGVVYQWTWNGEEGPIYFALNGRIRANKARVAPALNNYAAHGPWLYCKRDSLDNRYFWVDVVPGAVNGAGTTQPTILELTIPDHVAATTGAATPLYKITLSRYNNGNPKPVDAQTVTRTSADAIRLTFTLNREADDPTTGYAATDSDFYTFNIQLLAVTDADIAQADHDLHGGVTVEQGCCCSILRQIAMREVEVLLPQMSSKCRILAQGVRLTDVAMLQYVNGQIVGATCWDAYTWYDYFGMGRQGGRAFFDAVAQIPGAIPGDLWEGGYIYHKGTQATDYDWRDTMSWDPRLQRPDDLYVPIETNRPVKIIACTASNDNTAGNPTGGGASCYLTVATMLEWVPPVSCVEVRMSEWTRDACAAGCDALGFFPDFTSNDKHWSEFAADAFRSAGAPVLHAAINSGRDWLAKKFPSAKGPLRWLASAGHGAVSALAKEVGSKKRKGRGRN
jgi:hypothetical protein